MSILSKIARGFRDWTAEHWPKMSGFSSLPSRAIRIVGSDKPAENVVDVFAALEARCECMRQVPLRISDAGDNLIEGGELYDLFARPNQYMDFSQYIEAVETYLTLYDACYIAKVGEPGKAPDELIPLSPRYMQPVWGVHKPTGLRVPMGWFYTDPHSGLRTAWDWDSIIPILGFNPYAPFAGLSAVKVGERSIIQDMATREQNIAIFTNGGVPDLVLETSTELSPDEAKELLERWNDRNRGFSKSHSTAILDRGLKANKIGLNPQELQAFEALRFTSVDIRKVMRVMPAMIGDMQGETGLSQGSSTAEQKVAWWGQTGLGELARIAVAHQAYLVERYTWGNSTKRELTNAEKFSKRLFQKNLRGLYRAKNTTRFFLWFDVNQIEELVEHRFKRVEQFEKLRNQGYAPDDINDYLDLGLPAHPTNVGILPFSVQSVEDVGGAAPAPTPEQKSADPRSVAIIDKLDRVAELLAQSERASAKKYQALQKSVNALRAPMEKQAAKKYSRFFMEQRGRVLDRMKDERSATRAEADDLIKKILPLDDENKALLKLIGPVMAEQMKLAWENAATDVAKDSKKNPFEIDDPNIQKAIEKRKIQATKINDTTEEALRKIISDGFADGSSTTQIGDAIADYYAIHIGETSARPMTAAQTQVNGIINDSRLEKARKVGGVKKGWLHGSPQEPREDHLAAAEKYLAAPIGLDEKFIVGGVEMDGPGDSSAPIEQTANCTCMLVFSQEKSE